MRRGQAALEFLTTYGWALLVILVMIGALAYFGIINPNRFLPERCTFQQELTCKDWIVQKNSSNADVKFYVTNNLGKGMNAVAFSAIYVDGTTYKSCTIVGGTTIGAGQSTEVVCPAVSGTFPAAGDKVKFTLNGTYTAVGGQYPHDVQGEIFATLQ